MLVTDGRGEAKYILTKARNVSYKIDDQSGRQVMLMDMANYPELLESIYIEHNRIMVLFEGSEPLSIGILDQQYAELYNNRKLTIKSWKITGGYSLGESKFSSDVNKLAYYGLNLEIKIE